MGVFERAKFNDLIRFEIHEQLHACEHFARLTRNRILRQFNSPM